MGSYVIRKLADGQHHVMAADENGQPVGKSLSAHVSRQHAAARIKKLNAQSAKSWGDMLGQPYPSMSDNDADDSDNYVGDMMTPKLDQADPRVMYDPLGGNKSKACANCFFFDADDAACRLVSGDIVATGVCELWLRNLTPEEQDSKEVEVIAATPLPTQSGLLATVKQALAQFFSPTGEKASDAEPADVPLSGFKAFGPNNEFWVAFFSNNAQDRDGEWFSEKAHDTAIARLDSGGAPMPQLDYWHSKAYHGQAFWIDRIGHVTMAVGTFYDDPFSQAMKEYYATSAPDDNLVSFGYFYPRSALVDGVYQDYTPFEISPLPAEVAANPWTGFANLQEFKEMAMSDQKRKELEKRLGPALAAQLINQAGEKSAKLEQVETSFKAVDNDPVAQQVAALSQAVLMLVGEKAASEGMGEKPYKPTGRQGQPSSRQEQNDDSDVWDDTDEEDQDNFGALDPSERKQLKRLLSKARRGKAKATPPADDDDENASVDDDEDDDMPSKKNRRADQGNKELAKLASGYKATQEALAQVTDALQKISQKQAQFGNAINQLAETIYNPVAASRSPYTVVPPDDPAMDSLAAKMYGSPSAVPPNVQEAMEVNNMAAFLGLPTAFNTRS